MLAIASSSNMLNFEDNEFEDGVDAEDAFHIERQHGRR